MDNFNNENNGQPMGDMNQQPQFGQPMGGMNQPPKKVKKPLSKGAIGGIIGGGIALIALIVCAIIFLPKLFPSDKEVIVDAFEATFGVETEGEVEDVVGAQEIADKFATTGGVREYSMEITNDTLGETVNVGMVESIDVAGKLANSNITVGMNGTNILNANMIVDETNTYFQVPEMINGYFSLPNENILQALENSELGQAMALEGMPEFNMADLYFNLATSGTATELNGEYVTIIETLWDSITYEKQGKAKVDVNGKTVTAKEYFITVPEDAMKTAIGDMWDVAIQEVANNPAALAETGMDADTFVSSMGSYSAMLKGLISGDLIIKVYIADGEIVKLTCADDVKVFGTPIAYDLFMDIDDKKMSGVFEISVMDESVGVKFNVDNLDTNPTGVMTLYAAGEVVDINFKVTDNSSDSKEACDVYFDVVYGGTTYVTSDIKVNYDKSANTFDGSMVFDITDAGELQVDFAGGLKDINKGVGYTMELSKCDILADGTKLMGMTAKIKLDTSTHTATGIDTSLPVYDVTTMTEADFENILAENAALIEEWMNANPDLFSGYDEPVVEEPVEEPSANESDMILEGSGKSVEILGTIDGFRFDYATDWSIDYATEEYSALSYALYEGWTPEECVEFVYIPDEGVYTQETGGHTMEVDGETIYYSYVQYDYFGSTFSSYMFAKDLGDGVVLTVSVGIYDDDEPIQYTKEMLAEAISTKYYKIVE